jgi:hypothetical protein
VSRWAIYDWIRKGIIPAELVTRVAGTIRIDADKLEVLIKQGKLGRQRRGTGNRDAILRTLLSKLANDWTPPEAA